MKTLSPGLIGAVPEETADFGESGMRRAAFRLRQSFASNHIHCSLTYKGMGTLFSGSFVFGTVFSIVNAFQIREHWLSDHLRLEPSAARLVVLHARLIVGDHAALNQLAGEQCVPLCRRLRRAFPRAAGDLVADASNDAILTYAARPHAFDASRQVPLDHFLYGIAARILRDRLRSDKRREQRERIYAEHTLHLYQDQNDDRATSRAAMREIRDTLPLVCNPAELAAMVAWLNEDDTAVVAVCLGVSHFRLVEQRREVRSFTARVIKRLRRHFQGAKRKSLARRNS